MSSSNPVASRLIFAGDQVSVSELTRALWLYRFTVLALSLLGALGGVAVSIESTRYVSEGLFMTPNMTLANFKKYESALINEPRMEEFIVAAKLGDKQVAEQLRKLIRIPGQMALAVRPVFELTGSDARTYDIGTVEEPSGIVGLRLSMKRPEKDGKAPVLALAEYLRSTIIWVDLRQLLLDRCMEFRSRQLQLRNEKIESDFSISQMQSKAQTLRALIAQSPGARDLSDRQVVSLKNGGDRFLPPAAQLVAVEVGLADLELANGKRERDVLAAELKQKFFCDAHALQAAETITGQMMLARLGELRDAVFQGQDRANDVVEYTYNELQVLSQAWDDAYLDGMHFVVPLDDAEVRLREPRLSVGVVLGASLGLLLGVLGALLLAWWHDNRESVLVQSEE